MAKQELTCDDILKELRAKQYRPVYYLMGEEDYYIDLIAGYIEANVLTDEEKEFNQTVVYGADVDIATIINAAKRYPMMAEHQVVIVREAQAVPSGRHRPCEAWRNWPTISRSRCGLPSSSSVTSMVCWTVARSWRAR